jgi:hypothetical protein
MHGVATKSLGCLSESKVNGSICHPCTSFQISKTMEEYVIPTLESCIIATTSFDLWMSKFGHDTFAIVINFINSQWVPCHVTMALFEATSTIGVTMAVQVRDLLAYYNLLGN